jgi:hypothetical protein
MTMSDFKQDATLSQPRRGFLLSMLGAAGAGLLLPGCGGAATDQASVRFTNATMDFSSADFALAGSQAATSIANGGTTTGWVTLDSGTSQVSLSTAGSSTASLSESHAFAASSWTSVVAYGALSQGVKLRYFDESDAVPTSGSVNVRVFQGSPLLGSLDLYVSNESSLTGLAPTAVVSGYEALSAFVTLVAGTYRLRITASGNQANVLYDLPTGVALGSKEVITLVVAARASGSLPNVAALSEQLDSALLANALA